MCGIVGFTGHQQAAPILLEGLKKLEYRGYDSAGLAVRDGEKLAQVVKTVGKISNLSEKTNAGKDLIGTCGIGHTRWATHGEISKANAHPHVSGNCSGSGCGDVQSNVVGVHNGIIENYQELKTKLLAHGYQFYSSTDTEVLIKLVDYYYKKYNVGPIDALAKTMVRVNGSYALEVMFKDFPGEIYAARKDSPMLIGVQADQSFVASDASALLNYTRSVYYMDNMEMARIIPGKVEFYNLNGDLVPKELTQLDLSAQESELGGYQHFMIKEIHEQSGALVATLKSALGGSGVSDGGCEALSKADVKELGGDGGVRTEGTRTEGTGGESAEGGSLDDVLGRIKVFEDKELLRRVEQVVVVACGSAYHVGVTAQYVVEAMARVPVRVELASEFRYREAPIGCGTLCVVISQSGETADTLAALRMVRERGVPTFAIVNVPGSSIAREADYVFYTKAGAEISVATTKAYSCQLVVMYLFAMELALCKGAISAEECRDLIAEIWTLPGKVGQLLEQKERLQWFASKLVNMHDIFFLGRGLDYSICLEGSLKMKEISYIHSEAYAAGELKHGTISLIEPGRLVIGVLTQPSLYKKTLSNMTEAKTRGAYLMAVTNSGNFSIEDSTDFVVYIPKTSPYFTASLAVIPLQLLAYYTAVSRGEDVDKPRNLAKSVTVE